jgi:hypothetical protein
MTAIILGSTLASTLSCASQHLFFPLPCVARLICRHVAKALAGSALCLQLFLVRSKHHRACDSGHLASQARDTRGRLPFAEHRSVIG